MLLWESRTLHYFDHLLKTIEVVVAGSINAKQEDQSGFR